MRIGRKKAALLFGALAFAWTCLLFWFSGQDKQDSEHLSSWLTERLFAFLLEKGCSREALEFALRKAAHAGTFLLEGLLLALTALCLSGRRRLWVAALLSAALAGLNEFHERFSPGRNPALLDAAIDFAGALAGIALAAWLFERIHRKRTTNQTGEES